MWTIGVGGEGERMTAVISRARRALVSAALCARPACAPGDFDAESDIDLLDIAGFQNAFGTHP